MAGVAMELDTSPAAQLALFHTTFNLLGIALIWPVAGHMARFLEKRFRAAEEDEARPRYLDSNVAAVPNLALNALEQEIRRMGGISLRMMRDVIADGATGSKLSTDQQIVSRLNKAIADFITRMNQSGMSQGIARRLPQMLRTARYYESVAELAMETSAAKRETPMPIKIDAGETFQEQAMRLLTRVDPEGYMEYSIDVESGLQGLEGDYQILKAELLEAGAHGRLSVEDMDARLRAASSTRRAVQQATKAARQLSAETAENESGNETRR